MRVLRIVLMGAAVGIMSGVLTLMIELGLLLARVTTMSAHESGGAGLGAVSARSYAPFVALGGFVVGAFLAERRTRGL